MLPRTPAPRPVEVVRAGTVQNGEYLDADWPIRMRVPEGWTATPGARDEPLRLSLREPRTQVGLELPINHRLYLAGFGSLGLAFWQGASTPLEPAAALGVGTRL